VVLAPGMATARAARRFLGAFIAVAAGFAERSAVVAVTLNRRMFAAANIACAAAMVKQTALLATLLSVRRFGWPLCYRPGEIATGLSDYAGAELFAKS